MLSLQLKSGEYITIGDDIAVQVFEQSGSSFRVAVKAPRELTILRGEVHERSGDRPDGLHKRRPQSPSERRYNQKHREEWEEKRNVKQDVLRELTALTDDLDKLSDTALRARLSALRTELTALDKA